MMAYSQHHPLLSLANLWHYRDLLLELVKRDFIGRYKGSFFGIAWSLFHPLLMLAIYTLVFGVAFKARWNVGGEDKVAFAIVLFSGMIIHAFFAECITKAPTLIRSNPSYVKKIVFPLDILPWVTLFSAMLHFLVSFAVLLLFCFLANVDVHVGVLLTPIVILPLILMVIGISWILSSLGVYLVDLVQITGMFATITLFLAPVFYPVSLLPGAYQSFIFLNPITLPIEQLRDVMLFGQPLNWAHWFYSLLIGMVVSAIGYMWFQKTRKGFADVL